jgi:hypothetical protein
VAVSNVASEYDSEQGAGPGNVVVSDTTARIISRTDVGVTAAYGRLT